MILRLVLIAITGAAAVALVSALETPASTTPTTKLVGTTGPEFTITLKRAGKLVKTLRPGRYTITVSDRSNVHDFHLRGPRMEKAITTVPFKGTKTVSVTLRKGSYTYYCDPHEFGGMTHTFKVK